MTHDLITAAQPLADGLAERASRDPHRPRYHFTAPGGWLNDPNGLTHRDGVYHLFYQYNPLAPAHHRIHWGHATSTDLVTWTDEPVALVPGATGPDRDGCWSGVLVDDDGVPTLVYSGRHGDRELPCVATGTPDLRHWTKDPGNPVIPAPPAGLDLTAYRDHCVWKEDGRWRQLVGSGLRGQGGTALLYDSDDLRSWRYVGPLLTGDAGEGRAGEPDWTGTMWECVDLFQVAGTDVLAFSAWDEGTTHHPLYWTGRYEGDRFTPTALHRLDYGQNHFYAPQSTRDADGRRIMFGWLQEGRGEDATARAGWSGVMSLPRLVTLGADGALHQAPVPELARLRRDHVAVGPFTPGPDPAEALDAVRGDQLDLEATLRLAPGAVLRLGVRETPDGAERTVVELARAGTAPTATLRLRREASSLDPDTDTTPRAGEVPLAADGTVALRVLVDHSALEIFAGGRALASRVYPTRPDEAVVRAAADGSDFLRPDGYAPVIDTEDPGPDPHLSGRHGLLAYNGRVSYENVTAPGAAELPGGTTESCTWTRDLAGLRGHDGVRTAPAPAGPGLVVSADVRLAGARAAGLLVRGHAVLLDRQAGAVRLLDHARGTLLASAPPPVRPLRDGDLVRLEVHLLDGEFTVHADGVRVIDSAPAATTGGTVGLVADGGTAFFREVYAGDSRDHFTEPYRPAFHHSQRSGSASDPNGLVWFDGEYHLFHQDQGRWAHAVSTDLLHWRSLPRALDWNAYGHCWSGSAVADLHDASGLFDGGSGLIAYYTSHHPDRIGGNQSVRAAYSTDRGRSWQWYGGAEPLVGNPGGPDGGWDFRNPKVLRDEARDQWVMVVSGGDHVRFLTSRDLLHWTHVSSFGYGPWVTAGVWECPDLFPLPVDGDPGRTAWVLTLSTGAVRATDGSAAVYLTGTWDGTAFTPDQAPGGWLRSDHGRDFYAAITFDDTPDGRRIWLGWTTNWDYPFSAPTGPWQGQHSVPRVLSLAAGPAGHPVLRQWPVAELAALRAGSTVRTGLTAGPGLPDPCAGLTGTAYEIEAELAFPAEGSATDCAFLLRGKEGRAVRVGYDPGRGRLYLDRADSGRTDFTRWFAGRAEAPLAAAPDGGGGRTVRLRILVDSSSVEVFGGAGEAVLTGLVLPDPDAAGLSFTADGGTVRLVTLAHHPLGSTCRVGGAPGRTLPAAPPPGEFRTDLGALTVTPAGRWAPTGAGLTCVFDRDSDALSTRRFADLELTTLLRLGGADGVRGAASLLWRASADGADGYVLNVDPDLRAVRLVVRRGGSFDDAAALARVPLLVRHGVTYHLRVVHQGTRIRVFLDGSGIIDLTDPGAAFASGHVGLNVFGGRAGHQDTYAKEL